MGLESHCVSLPLTHMAVTSGALTRISSAEEMGENETGKGGRARDDAEAGEKTQARVDSSLSPTDIQCALVSEQRWPGGGESLKPLLHIIIVVAAG